MQTCCVINFESQKDKDRFFICLDKLKLKENDPADYFYKVLSERCTDKYAREDILNEKTVFESTLVIEEELSWFTEFLVHMMCIGACLLDDEETEKGLYVKEGICRERKNL